VNGQWVRSFLNGRHRQEWRDIARTALDFVDALDRMDWNAAVDAMNREVDIRKAMTPDVLDEMGDALTAAAREIGCGARFTGAGAGGCLWALGAESAVAELRGIWERLLSQRSDARLLAAGLDTEGLRVDCRRRE
jgi:D-glycero-alpha-D-manno-heptose-7-phosphate kinase